MGDFRENVCALLKTTYLQNNDTSSDLRYFSQLSDVYQSFRSQKQEETGEVLSHINRCLNSSENRLEGLLLLHQVIRQCSTDLFVEHAPSWVKQLLLALQTHNVPRVHQIGCLVLVELVNHSVVFSELYRDLSTSLIPSLVPTLLPTLLTAGSQLEQSSLSCLRSCMQHFSGPCGLFKNKIESKLIQCLHLADADDSRTTLLCELHALLPSLGGGGNKGGKKAENWSGHLDKLLATLHRTLDQLYTDLETDSYERPAVGLSFPPPPVTEPGRVLSLLNTYKVLCQALSAVFTQPMPVAVSLPVEDTLDLLCRALAISPKFLMMRPTQERILLCSILPVIHQMSLHVLEKFIICVQGNLIVHGPVINKLLVQCLTYFTTDGSTDKGNQENPLNSLRRTVYKVTTAWLSVVGASSGLVSVANDLISQALLDAKPHVESVKINASMSSKSLQIAEEIWKTGRKKKKGGGQKDGSSWQHKHDPTANWAICAAALNALKQLLMCCGPLLKPSHHKSVQAFCLPLLLELQQSSVTPAAPYSHVQCRSALYKLVLACVLAPNPRWPPPTHIALRIFSQGLTSEGSIELRDCCRESLLVCQNLIHPRTPPLTSPLSLEELTELKAATQMLHQPQKPQNPMYSQIPCLNQQTEPMSTSTDSSQNLSDRHHVTEPSYNKFNNESAVSGDNQQNDDLDLETITGKIIGLNGSALHQLYEKNDSDIGEEDNSLNSSEDGDQDDTAPTVVELSNVEQPVAGTSVSPTSAKRKRDQNSESEETGPDPENENANTVDLDTSSIDPEITSDAKVSSGEPASTTITSLKRKQTDDDDDDDDETDLAEGEKPNKKIAEDTELMMEAFIDADPDSE